MRGDCSAISSQFLPNKHTVVAQYWRKAFCGTYSKNGDTFLSACQDQHIRAYDCRNGFFKEFKKVRARDVGWSVLDTAYSPDGLYFIYSSWSPAVHICNVYGDHQTQTPLDMRPAETRFACFSVKFSHDNTEILAGANDGCIYIYDREANERSLCIQAHEDDVNTVAFADSTSQILFSGGDDGLVKVWDRRSLSEEHTKPVGYLTGHTDGVTFIDSKGDGRYLISNGKDQTVKLWDIRRFGTHEGAEQVRKAVSKQNWDYRWQPVPKKNMKKMKLNGDVSVMTYRGHGVLHTLIRAYFSPEFTTGQQYIYSGCSTGKVVIWDTLSGEIVKRLSGQRQCVRDVSWHPYENKIVSTSWDGSLYLWEFENEEDEEGGKKEEEKKDGKYNLRNRPINGRRGKSGFQVRILY
jgi:WD repeat-containing protein 23